MGRTRRVAEASAAFGFRALTLVGHTDMLGHVTAFVRAEATPLVAVLVQIGDCPFEYCFVPNPPIMPIARLLSDWTANIHFDEVPYNHLNAASLESLFGVPR